MRKALRMRGTTEPKRKRSDPATGKSETHLGVDVQNADLPSVDHLVDGVDLGAVDVAVVLAVLQETPALDVAVHLGARHEGVHLSVLLVHLGFPGGDWGRGEVGI